MTKYMNINRYVYTYINASIDLKITWIFHFKEKYPEMLSDFEDFDTGLHHMLDSKV